jgi:hypothetical protein
VRVLWAAVAAVAGLQLVLVHTHGLSRWKGGGLGMYSEPHPNKRQLIARGADGAALGPLSGCPEQATLRFSRWPTPEAAAAISPCLPPGAAAVALLAPELEPSTGRLSWREVARRDVR